MSDTIEKSNKLKLKRAEHSALFKAHAEIEEGGTEKGDAFIRDHVEPVERQIRANVEALTASKPKAMHECLAKVSALIDTDMTPETVAAIQADIARLSEPDPVPDLCRRVLSLSDFLNGANATNGPEWQEAWAVRADLLDRLATMTPTSPEGVALMMSAYWSENGPSALAGTPDWEAAMSDPQNRLFLKIREGAYRVSGLLY